MFHAWCSYPDYYGNCAKVRIHEIACYKETLVDISFFTTNQDMLLSAEQLFSVDCGGSYQLSSSRNCLDQNQINFELSSTALEGMLAALLIPGIISGNTNDGIYSAHLDHVTTETISLGDGANSDDAKKKILTVDLDFEKIDGGEIQVTITGSNIFSGIIFLQDLDNFCELEQCDDSQCLEIEDEYFESQSFTYPQSATIYVTLTPNAYCATNEAYILSTVWANSSNVDWSSYVVESYESPLTITSSITQLI